MASTFSSPSLLSTTTTGPLFFSNHPHSPPSSVTLRVSATAESQLGLRIAAPGGSLYEVLGIQMGATCQEVKTAYRRLARILHPDVAACGDDDEFMKVQQAYETLSDPEKRANYNRSLFMRRRCMSGSASVVMSASSKTTSSSSSSGFSGYSRRRWETDQCW